MACDLVGAAIELVIGQRDGIGDDGVVIGEAKTHLFVGVIEPLAFAPAQRVVARDQRRRAHGRALKFLDRSRQMMGAVQMQLVAQLDDGAVGGWTSAELADLAGMDCHCRKSPNTQKRAPARRLRPFR